MRELGAGMTLFLCMPFFAGCGGGKTATFALTCVTHRLAGGFVRANVTVTNTTARRATAFVYGLPLPHMVHVHPVLRPAEVLVDVSGVKVPYVGLALPRVGPKASSKLIIRFGPMPTPQAIVVSDRQSFQSSDYGFLANSACRIRS